MFFKLSSRCYFFYKYYLPSAMTNLRNNISAQLVPFGATLSDGGPLYSTFIKPIKNLNKSYLCHKDLYENAEN